MSEIAFHSGSRLTGRMHRYTSSIDLTAATRKNTTDTISSAAITIPNTNMTETPPPATMALRMFMPPGLSWANLAASGAQSRSADWGSPDWMKVSKMPWQLSGSTWA